MFKREWFQIVDGVTEGGAQCRAWDLAATHQSAINVDPDYTVGLKGTRTADGTFYITNMQRLRSSPGMRDQAILEAANLDGTSCTVRMPQDPGQAGKSQAEHFARLLAGFSLRILSVSGDKKTRASPAASQAEFDKIKLVRGHWNEDFLDELCNFPNDAHDDIVDALSDLIDELSGATTYDLEALNAGFDRLLFGW